MALNVSKWSSSVIKRHSATNEVLYRMVIFSAKNHQRWPWFDLERSASFRACRYASLGSRSQWKLVKDTPGIRSRGFSEIFWSLLTVEYSVDLMNHEPLRKGQNRFPSRRSRWRLLWEAWQVLWRLASAHAEVVRSLTDTPSWCNLEWDRSQCLEPHRLQE